MKVNPDIIRIYKTLHTWVGIISGMALFIAFYAGALTIFKDPITRWATAPISQPGSTPLDDIPALIARVIETNPAAARAIMLNLSPEADHTHQLMWVVTDETAGDHDTSANRYYSARLDQQDQLQVEQIHPTSVAQFIDTLHRVVGLPVDSDPNRWVMGIFSALYAMALISGLIILLPILVKELFALRLGRKPKRVWLDAHNVVGVTSLPFHIIMACTAFAFAYHDLLYGTQDKLIHEGNLRQAFVAGSPVPNPEQSTDPATMLSPTQLLAITQSISSDFKPHQIEYNGLTTPRASVRIWGHDDKAIEPRHPGGFININPYTGEIQSTDYFPGKQSGEMVTLSSFFALHFATYGGSAIHWVYFLLGLVGAWLFYTGNLLWVENRRKYQKPNGETVIQRRDVRVMAALTVGICVGSVCGISLMLAASKWLSIDSPALLSSFKWLYYLMFFAAIGWSFYRGAARSLVHLLWLAAFLTVLIPFTSLLSVLMPSIGLWAHTDLSSLMVDITAFVMAIGFVLLARATARRVYSNKVLDSVWSYSPQVVTS